MITIMAIDSEKNARRMLAGGVLFATVGILALAITLMQPTAQEERERVADEIFDTEAEIAAKYEVLAALSASNASSTRNAEEIPEEEKLRVLESLKVQRTVE